MPWNAESRRGAFRLENSRLLRAGRHRVFLHGLGGNHLSWWQQVPFFMRWFECITLDQRGFGLSQDPDGAFNRVHSRDLVALLDHLGIQKAALVGQSMGGWTIVGAALEQPERFAALVMADTPGGISTPEMDALRAAAGRATLPLDTSPPIGALPTYARDYFVKRPEMAYLYDSLRILGARPPDDALERIVGLRHDLDKVRQRLTMPILCIEGEEDVLILPAVIRAMVPALPNGRLAMVPGCGHSVYFENAPVFNQLVLDFLSAVGYAAAS